MDKPSVAELHKILEEAAVDGAAVLRRARYIQQRMEKSDFSPDPGKVTADERVLKGYALLLAGLASLTEAGITSERLMLYTSGILVRFSALQIQHIWDELAKASLRDVPVSGRPM